MYTYGAATTDTDRCTARAQLATLCSGEQGLTDWVNRVQTSLEDCVSLRSLVMDMRGNELCPRASLAVRSQLEAHVPVELRRPWPDHSGLAARSVINTAC